MFKSYRIFLKEQALNNTNLDEYLNDEDIIYDDDLANIIKIKGVVHEIILNNCFLELKFNDTTYYYQRDDDEYFDKLAKIDSRCDLLSHILYHTGDDFQRKCANLDDIGDLRISAWGRTIKQTQDNPPVVYHHTTKEKLEDILKSGYLKMGRGSSLTNRHVQGVFTTVDPEEYALGEYGDVMLVIDLPSFKQQLNAPLNLEPEPTVIEAEIGDFLAHLLDCDNHHTEHGGESPHTIVVGHNIPKAFITLYEK